MRTTNQTVSIEYNEREGCYIFPLHNRLLNPNMIATTIFFILKVLSVFSYSLIGIHKVQWRLCLNHFFRDHREGSYFSRCDNRVDIKMHLQTNVWHKDVTIECNLRECELDFLKFSCYFLNDEFLLFFQKLKWRTYEQ